MQHTCPNCHGHKTKWHADTRKTSNVVDGRLKSEDLQPIVYLGCEECSETIKVVTGYEFVEMYEQACQKIEELKTEAA